MTPEMKFYEEVIHCNLGGLRYKVGILTQAQVKCKKQKKEKLFIKFFKSTE